MYRREGENGDGDVGTGGLQVAEGAFGETVRTLGVLSEERDGMAAVVVRSSSVSG